MHAVKPLGVIRFEFKHTTGTKTGVILARKEGAKPTTFCLGNRPPTLPTSMAGESLVTITIILESGKYQTKIFTGHHIVLSFYAQVQLEMNKIHIQSKKICQQKTRKR